MKDKCLKTYTIIGVFFVLAAGSLAHFLYDWTGSNAIAGLFVPVNESVWEHMKLLFFPMLLYCALEHGSTGAKSAASFPPYALESQPEPC